MTRRIGILAFFWLTALGVWGEEASAPSSTTTTVSVQHGRVELFNDQGRLQILAGEDANMQAGKAPFKMTSDLPPPTEKVQVQVPLDVAWVPATRTLSAEGEAIVFKAKDGGWDGQSASGRFRGNVNAQGVVRVEEVLDAAGKPFEKPAAGRSATFAPDGVWTYRFGGSVLTVFSSGKTVLKLPDGKVVESVTPTASAALPDPGYNWRIGVKLDEGAQGRLIVGQVYPQSPAAKAKFHVGDEVRAVNGHKDPSLDQILYELKKSKVGELVRFTVRRKVLTVDLTVVSGDWD